MHVTLSLPANWTEIVQRHRSRWERALSQPRTEDKERHRRRKIEAAVRVLYTQLGRQLPQVTWLDSFPGLVQSGTLPGRRGSKTDELRLVSAPSIPDDLQRISWQSICRLQLAVRLGARLERRTLKVLAALSKLIRHAGGCLLYPQRVVAVRRPVQLLYNNGLIHATHAPAIVWADNLAMEVWHGVPTGTPRVFSADESIVMQLTTREAPNPVWAAEPLGAWAHVALPSVRYGELYFRPQSSLDWCRLRAAVARNWDEVEHGIGYRRPEPVSPDSLVQYFYWVLVESGQQPPPLPSTVPRLTLAPRRTIGRT